MSKEKQLLITGTSNNLAIFWKFLADNQKNK
jgi:hypothetical protein